MSAAHTPDLDAYWIPFTPNRQFKKNPRLFSKAEGMYLYTPEGKKTLDGLAGLWCVNAGHTRKEIVDRITKQASEYYYAPAFQTSHPLAFELANRLVKYMPEGINKVFYTNSGSESVETALKIAIAYQHARGKPGKYRLIGREKAYHGVNFGGISVGGLPANRKTFGPLLNGVDHMPHTHGIEANKFSKGIPEHGVELADELESIIMTHDPSTVAAVIVEPIAGSAGVLLPPKG
ncbi:MAG: aminotransferase class III-fold pyridoxal phosphate-dependent enzyme, partial [Rickettsiales bacterium]